MSAFGGLEGRATTMSMPSVPRSLRGGRSGRPSASTADDGRTAGMPGVVRAWCGATRTRQGRNDRADPHARRARVGRASSAGRRSPRARRDAPGTAAGRRARQPREDGHGTRSRSTKRPCARSRDRGSASAVSRMVPAMTENARPGAARDAPRLRHRAADRTTVLQVARAARRARAARTGRVGFFSTATSGDPLPPRPDRPPPARPLLALRRPRVRHRPARRLAGRDQARTALGRRRGFANLRGPLRGSWQSC